MQTVIETPVFIADVKAAGITAAERDMIIAAVAGNPLCGVEIPGTGGARKIRFAGRGKGKSGGYRVVSFFGGDDVPVFLLNVFAKGDRVDLTQAARNELRKILREIADHYRTGVADHAESR